MVFYDPELVESPVYFAREYIIRCLQSSWRMECLSCIPMVIVKIRWLKFISDRTMWSCTSYILLSLLLWISHMVWHAYNLVRLTTLIRRMSTSTIVTMIILAFRPTLTSHMIYFTGLVIFLLLSILINFFSRRRSPIVPITILIFCLILTSLVL